MADKEQKPRVEKRIVEDLTKAFVHERPEPDTSPPTTRTTSQSLSQQTPQNQQQSTTSKTSE